MGDFNRAIVMGNVGRDPQLREGDDFKVVRFSLATNKRFKGRDGDRREVTNWHNIVVWNPHIIDFVMKYVQKGSRLLVEGEIQTRSYEKEGQKHYSTEIVVDRFNGNVTFAGGGEEKKGEDRSPSTHGYGNDVGSADPDDDIPF